MSLIEKSLSQQLTDEEHDLLNLMRDFVCTSGILDAQLAKQDKLIGNEGANLLGNLNLEVSDIYMAPTIDRALR